MSYLSRNLDKPFTIIAAIDSNRGIGKVGSIPWRCPEDLKFFKDITTWTRARARTWNAVIMGRRTWESLPGNKGFIIAW